MSLDIPLDWFEQLAYKTEAPKSAALFKQQPADFYVSEVLGFAPEDNPVGQHHWLFIRKVNLNTQDVVQALSKFAAIHPNKVGFSGLKDKYAITEQWFSIELPTKTMINWDLFAYEGVTLLKVIKSTKKLKRGTHKGNLFKIKLRELTNPEAFHARLTSVATGVPNYFGPQRFGIENNNLKKAFSLFEGRRISNRNQKSLALSAARSYLFNQLVSQRLNQFDSQLLAGDLLNLTGSNSVFLADEITESLKARFASQDISPTAPLYGKGELGTQLASAIFEQATLAQYQRWQTGLAQANLQIGRRAIWLFPQQIQAEPVAQDVVLTFELPTGSYATSVLRELVQF